MKKLLVFFVFAYSNVGFSFDIEKIDCFYGFEKIGIRSLSESSSDVDESLYMSDEGVHAVRCIDRDKVARNLQAISIFFGGMATIAGVCPEPMVTKGTAAILAAGGFALGSMSFLVSGIECEKRHTLNKTQREEVIKVVCKQLGKRYVTVPEPHCAADW